jgi:hypothetical protein
VIHLTIRTAVWDGEDCHPGDRIIDERNISLGEALEMVLGNIWSGLSLANCASRLVRMRIRDQQSTELALFYESYLGRSGPEFWERMPDPCFSFWYSFTRPSRSADEQWLVSDDWSHFQNLYDAVAIYVLHYQESDVMRVSPEAELHIERLRRRAAIVA